MKDAMIKAAGVWHLLVRANLSPAANDAPADEAMPDPDSAFDESQSWRLA